MGNIKENGNLLLENKKIVPEKLKNLEIEIIKEEQKINRLKCPSASGRTLKEIYDGLS